MDVSNRLGSKTFLPIDQDMFATLSGDINPMHVDAVAARRTQAGAPVVHGIHAVLWALDLLFRNQPERRVADVSVRFERFIYVGEEVDAVLSKTLAGTDVVELRTDGTRAAVVTFTSLANPSCGSFSEIAPHPISAPLIRDIEDLNGLADAFILADEGDGLMRAFPHVCRGVGVDTIRSFAGLSTLVGMECPGLYSIFSKLHVRLSHGSGHEPIFRYSVRRLQTLLRSAVIDVQAPGLTGNVEVFVRHPPIAQPHIESLRPNTPGELTRDDHVLVVGGSRGLGELTAKLVALGGAKVTITYARGAAEAQAVAEEITAAGLQCAVTSFDARLPVPPQLAGTSTPFTHCYYFATPPIFRKRGSTFDRSVLDTFITFYVDTFFGLVEYLAAANPQVRIFMPSTTAIDESPPGSFEYVAAKLAGERLADDMRRLHPQTKIEIVRLPRILTDQTATVLPVRSENPVSILVPLIADLHRR